MGKIFAVTSGKGGVGKSTFSVCLASTFAKAYHKRTVLVDLDEGLRCLDIILAADSKIVFDLADAVNAMDVNKALYKIEGNENLFLIPASDKTGCVDVNLLGEFIEKLEKEFDVVILDFPAGIQKEIYSVLPLKTQFLTVCVPENISIRDAAAVNKVLRESNKTSLLVINRFDIKKMRKGIYRNIDEMIDLSGLRLTGIVPESDELALLAYKHKIKKRGRVSRAFKRITDRLIGKKTTLPKFKKI